MKNFAETMKFLAKRARRTKRKAEGNVNRAKITGASERFCKMIADCASAQLKARYSRKRNIRKYGQGFTLKAVPVEAIGTVLKKKDGLVTAFSYERKPNGQIVKVAA